VTQQCDEFQGFANGLISGGWLKPWKAFSILNMIEVMPEVFETRERGINYINNCLIMEGFSESDCVAIYEYLVDTRSLM
jgi:hypothetical protein